MNTILNIFTVLVFLLVVVGFYTVDRKSVV